MKIRKCLDYLLLVIVLLIAADRYYPAAMSMLGMGAEKPCGRNAEGGEGQSLFPRLRGDSGFATISIS